MFRFYIFAQYTLQNMTSFMCKTWKRKENLAKILTSELGNGMMMLSRKLGNNVRTKTDLNIKEKLL